MSDKHPICYQTLIPKHDYQEIGKSKDGGMVSECTRCHRVIVTHVSYFQGAEVQS